MDNKIWDIYNIPRASLPITENKPLIAEVGSSDEKTPLPEFHTHFALELGFVLSGKIKILYKNWETELDAGKICCCGIWEPHGWQITEVPFKGFLFYIWPPMLFHLRFEEAKGFNWMSPFTAPPDERPGVFPGGLKKMNELCKRIEKILSGGVSHPALRLRLQVIETLLDIQRNWEVSSSSVSAGIMLGDYYVKIAKAIEMAFVTREFIPEKVAAAGCGMSRNSFNKNFKDLMGTTFSELTHSYRLSNAAKEILETDAAIKSIALNWGFTDTSHFLKCFRSHYLCTPLEYKKKYNFEMAS